MGLPVHEDKLLFEFLILEGAQAGLSCNTILKKRKGYRKAFKNFNVFEVALYKEAEIKSLMQNSDIIRNSLKIESAISGEKAFL